MSILSFLKTTAAAMVGGRKRFDDSMDKLKESPYKLEVEAHRQKYVDVDTMAFGHLAIFNREDLLLGQLRESALADLIDLAIEKSDAGTSEILDAAKERIGWLVCQNKDLVRERQRLIDELEKTKLSLEEISKDLAAT